MIGFNILKSHTSDYILKESDCLKKEEWHRVSKLFELKGISYSTGVISSQYDGYPVSKWDNEDAFILVEGIIYNQSDEWVKSSLADLSRDFNKSLLSHFVRDTDGDYVICIVNKKNSSILVFNDELGGLPFNYKTSDDSFVAGRNLTWITEMGGAEISRENVAELLLFNYNNGSRTPFANISCLTPAQYIICSETSDKLHFEIGNTVEVSFELCNPYKTKEEAINDLKKLYLEGCRNRCEYAKTHGYKIINTMSGGYDSRTVLGGIEAYIQDGSYTNLTYEYKQDESIVARKVLNALNSKSEFVKLKFDNKSDYCDREHSIKTEGKIATYINSICYNDLNYSHDNYVKGEKVLYFGGFGGEFLRHPLFNSIYNAYNISYKYRPSLQEAVSISNADYLKTREMIAGTFKKTKGEAFCKEFYDEYYRRYVRCSGEDRDRMFAFNVQPLMCKYFILAIRNRVPLKWVGYEFHTAFLKALNPALVSVELFGGRPNIFSNSSLKKEDLKNKSILWNIIRLIAINRKVSGNADAAKQILPIISSNPLSFNLKYLDTHFSSFSLHNQCKIAALYFYLSQLDNEK